MNPVEQHATNETSAEAAAEHPTGHVAGHQPAAGADSSAAAPPEDDGWSWAMVEIMGHRSHVGRIREVDQFGTKMLRVDVPIYVGRDENEGRYPRKIVDVKFVKWTTHFYSGPAVFCITPTDEADARRLAARNATVDPPTAARLVDHSADDDSEYDQSADDDEDGE